VKDAELIDVGGGRFQSRRSPCGRGYIKDKVLDVALNAIMQVKASLGGRTKAINGLVPYR
jgi:hypothetical protein